jgi:hypothetical protein
MEQPNGRCNLGCGHPFDDHILPKAGVNTPPVCPKPKGFK